LADAIKKKFGVDALLIKSGGGVFEVSLNGKKIFSKKEVGRFPEPAEIFNAIAKS